MDSNSRRIFNRLINFEDKTMTAFSAEDLRQLQDIVNQNQKGIIILHDQDFIQQALFVFANTEGANSLYMEGFESYEFVDRVKSRNIRRDEIKNAITLRDPEKDGTMVSHKIKSINKIKARSFMLVSDHFTPSGSGIEYFISNDNYNYHPILPNINTQTILHDYGDSINIAVNIYPNAAGTGTVAPGGVAANEQPEIYYLAVLYENEVINDNYGITEIRDIYDAICMNADALGVVER